MKTISGPLLRVLIALAALAVSAAPVFAATTLDREFRYDASRFRLLHRPDGTTDVQMRFADRELRPGRPDLPVVGERVELAIGQRLASVEVLEVSAVPLAHGVRLASTQRLEPGLDRFERTPPDPAYFAGDHFVPDPLATPGVQGFERGRNVATLAVAPVRWNPATGELERVERIRLRLVLEDTPDRPLVRERIVPEWEEGGVTRAARPTALVGPGGRTAEPFKATQIPSLLGSPVAYVIVTNDAMAPVFQQLADWKTQSGVPAVVRTLSFIRQQYPGGTDDAEKVRMFLKDAYSRWGTKWVLIGGDTDVIPVRLARTTYYNGEWIATDMYYSCLDGNWDGDGDSIFGEGLITVPYSAGDQCDLYPEVYVGRAPASTPAEAQVFVDKSFGYERQPVSDYMTRLLAFAEVLFPQDWQPGQETSLDGAELIDYDLLPITDTQPQLHVARMYENYLDPRWRPGSTVENKALVVDSLDVGYNISMHVGHGYRNVMHVGDTDLQNSDMRGLTNGSRQTNLYATNCSSTAIDYASITEDAMKNPNGGAVTVVGSTRYDFPAYGRQYESIYFQLLFQQGVNAIGELQARQKLPFIAYSTNDGPQRWTQMTLILLGDPELRIFTTTPRILAVTAPATLAVSDSTFTVHVETGGAPLDSAIVTLYRADDEYVSSRTWAGDVTLPVRPDSVGTMTLTVTGYNCKPYQATITVVPGGAPALAERAVRIQDDGGAGSVGNGDGLWDAGETIAISPVLRNNGGAAAGSVTATLMTTDSLVTLPRATASYGTIAAGDSAAPSPAFLVQIPSTAPDQREVPFTLRLSDAGGRTYVEHFSVTLRAPEMFHVSHLVIDSGNHDGVPNPGESAFYYVRLRNLGTGTARAITAKLRSLGPGITVTDSSASWPDLAAGQEAQGDAFQFAVASDTTKLLLVVSDEYGECLRQTLDIGYPQPPSDLLGTGGATDIALTWTKTAAADLRGYFVYRSSSSAGPWTKITPVPTGRIAYYDDVGLTPLTRYYHEVSAVDSSGNESARTALVSTSTNPPLHGMFPIPTGHTTPAPIALEHLYPGYRQDIVAGSDYLYLWHPDGTTPVDADGSGATSGDFTNLGNYYAAGATVADIDGGDKEVIAPTWFGNNGTGAGRVCVFDLTGASKAGWPFQTVDNLWSSVAVGDLFGDGQKELVFSSNSNHFYALRANGTELRDGDSNPATLGVFKVLGNSFNYGSPAIAPLQNDGTRAIVYASTDAKVYAWRPDGSDVPGFPFTMNAGTPASVAVGSLDGPGGPLSIVVPSTGDSLYVISANGTRRPGFPVYCRMEASTGKVPSPALADMNNDGYLDVVQPASDGTMWVFDRNGAVVPPWSGIRYSVVTSQCTESSPVVADVNGDGHPDILIGDEMGQLTCLSGADGSVLAGFPIQLGGEVRGTPAVGDIDGDGMTEIALTDWDKNVYIWDYDFPYSPGVVPPWPQFHHDAARTGYAGTLPDVGVPSADGAAPRVLELAPPAPNPARATTRIWYGVPSSGGALDLAIYDLAGRRVRTLESGRAQAGRHSADWDLRDASGSPAGAGVYFARVVLGNEARSKKIVVIR